MNGSDTLVPAPPLSAFATAWMRLAVYGSAAAQTAARVEQGARIFALRSRLDTDRLDVAGGAAGTPRGDRASPTYGAAMRTIGIIRTNSGTVVVGALR